MKKIYKVLFGLLTISSMFLFSHCDFQDDVYVNLDMDTELNAFGAGDSVNTSSDFCLDNFDDYSDNVENLESIQYLSAAFFTTEESNGLNGNLTFRLYQGDGTTLLCEVNVPDFNADDYLDKPLPFDLTDEEINNINEYLANYKENQCFKAELIVTNVSDNDGLYFQLNGRVDFLARLKVSSII